MASFNKSTMYNTNTTTNCAACGKEGGNHNMCNKCKMVKYCNAACKKKHRTKHKKQCEKRVAELHDEALFKEHPPREDCPICFLPLPLNPGETTFEPCCAKIICNGCLYAMIEEARGRGEEIALCAFCRTLSATSGEEVKQIKRLVEAGNAYAFYNFAGWYARGIMGMQQDLTKARELWLRAGELGCHEGYYNLGVAYKNGRGVEVDKKRAINFYELAAINGNVQARHNLGSVESKAGNHYRAMKHFLLAARAGDKKSLDQVKKGFMHSFVTKEDYADTLRAHQKIHDEMKSDMRDKARVIDRADEVPSAGQYER